MFQLTNFLSFFAALSLATERITEIIKGMPLLSRWLAVQQPASSSKEEFRQASIHIVALSVGTALAYLTRDQVSSLTGMHNLSNWMYVLMGAMACGGSSMANSVLDIVSEVNHQKQLLTQQLQSNVSATPMQPGPPVPASSPNPPVAPPNSAPPAGDPNQQRAPTPPPSDAGQVILSAPTPGPTGLSAPPATGEQLLQLARQHVGEKYDLSAKVPKNNANYKGAWTCSEFVSWLVFQVTQTLYGCDNDKGDPATARAYTGYWHRDAQSKDKGQVISVEQAARTPGAAVLRLPQPPAMGHIVVSDGQGGTVEAHSPIDGVISFMLSARRWDLGILVPGIAYSQGPAVTVSPPSPGIYRLKDPPMTGNKVAEIQEKLKGAGSDPGKPDGAFGPSTHAAVVDFQKSHGLVPDGEVGPQTAAALGVQLA